MVQAKLFITSQMTLLVEKNRRALVELTLTILCNQHTEGLDYTTSNTKSSKDRTYNGEVAPRLRQVPL